MKGDDETTTSKILCMCMAAFALVLSIPCIYLIGIHVNGYIGSFNPHGTYGCAYDDEGFWSISFAQIQGPQVTPRAVKDVLYLDSKAFDSDERTKGGSRYFSKLKGNYTAVFHPNAISCETASAQPGNGKESVPVSFVADPFLFIVPQESRSLGSVGFEAAGILEDLNKATTVPLFAFYEMKVLTRMKGEIGVSFSVDGGKSWKHLGGVLKNPMHLSYPFIVFDDLHGT